MVITNEGEIMRSMKMGVEWNIYCRFEMKFERQESENEVIVDGLLRFII